MTKIKFKKEQFLSTLGRLSETITQLAEGKEYILEIKENREKRSLDANAYFWVLCGKLAAKLSISKDIIYRNLIRDIGGNNYISPVLIKDKENAIRFWESHGIGWVCEDTGSSKIEGCTNLIYYAGSSVYDTAQMSRLINLIVQECKQQGIETKTPDEIARMVSLWESR